MSQKLNFLQFSKSIESFQLRSKHYRQEKINIYQFIFVSKLYGLFKLPLYRYTHNSPPILFFLFFSLSIFFYLFLVRTKTFTMFNDIGPFHMMRTNFLFYRHQFHLFSIFNVISTFNWNSNVSTNASWNFSRKTCMCASTAPNWKVVSIKNCVTSLHSWGRGWFVLTEINKRYTTPYGLSSIQQER